MESEYVIVKDNSKAHDNPDRPKEQSYSWDRSNDGYSKITYKEDFHFEASDYCALLSVMLCIIAALL